MMKCRGSTPYLLLILRNLRMDEVAGMCGVAVKCVEITQTPIAKAGNWAISDAEARKRGEQTGLDTLVVHALNDGY